MRDCNTTKAPFPYYGGKSSIAPDVWARLGDCRAYVEPFAGSAAMLLARPVGHQNLGNAETLNDADGLIANFWRAVTVAPDDVAQWADWPINECDLHARHIWLVNRKDSLQARLEGDADFFDAKVAGWWLWGICAWIGSGWCSGDGPWQSVDGLMVKTDADGVRRKLPHLGDAGRGINRQRPHLGNELETLDECGRWSEHLRRMMRELQNRLRGVRVCCGDWARICGPSPTFKHGVCGVFLDPPYADMANRASDLYRVDCEQVAHRVRAWAIANGDNPLLRIALCGYVGEHDMPDSWDCWAWKAQGGYGNQRLDGINDNGAKERIWFSPHCLNPQPTLFV